MSIFTMAINERAGFKRFVDDDNNSQSTNHNRLVANACKRLKSNGVFEEKSSGLLPFQSFTSKGSAGIPARYKILEDVDVQNICEELPRYYKGYRRDVSLADFCHVDQYLSAKEFNIELLSNRTYDGVVNAIISYLLDWPTAKLDEFIVQYPEYDNLCYALCEIREMDRGIYVYDYNGIPVVRTAIKIIKAHFKPKSDGQDSFDWTSLIDYEFIQHVRQVYNHLVSGQVFTSQMIDSLERPMPIPYCLPNIDVSTLKEYYRPDNLKFITGEACCCKTTIVTKLTEMGWKKYSRGDIGGFNKKPENRAAVGNLHAALNYVLTRSDVIGDRSFIDNVLWSFIMPACDPRNKNVVNSLFAFLDANFNEPSIAEYIRHKGVVFIDPRSDKNKERQLKRCEDGDPWRGRLKNYADVQFIAYYVVARLFGWEVICVPYTETGEIDEEQYQRNVDRIVNFFGKPICSGNSYVRFQKPSNSYQFDYTFPKAVGIYK